MGLAESDLNLIKEDEKGSKLESFKKSMTKEKLEQTKKDFDHPEVLDQVLSEINNNYFDLKKLKNEEVRIGQHIKLRPDFYSLVWLYSFKSKYILSGQTP